MLEVFPAFNFRALRGAAIPLADQWVALVEGQQPLPEAVVVPLGEGASSFTLRFYHKDFEYWERVRERAQRGPVVRLPRGPPPSTVGGESGAAAGGDAGSGASGSGADGSGAAGTGEPSRRGGRAASRRSGVPPPTTAPSSWANVASRNPFDALASLGEQGVEGGDGEAVPTRGAEQRDGVVADVAVQPGAAAVAGALQTGELHPGTAADVAAQPGASAAGPVEQRDGAVAGAGEQQHAPAVGLAEGQRGEAAVDVAEQQVGASAGAGEQQGAPAVSFAEGQRDGAAVGATEQQGGARAAAGEEQGAPAVGLAGAQRDGAVVGAAAVGVEA